MDIYYYALPSNDYSEDTFLRLCGSIRINKYIGVVEVGIVKATSNVYYRDPDTGESSNIAKRVAKRGEYLVRICVDEDDGFGRYWAHQIAHCIESNINLSPTNICYYEYVDGDMVELDSSKYTAEYVSSEMEKEDIELSRYILVKKTSLTRRVGFFIWTVIDDVKYSRDIFLHGIFRVKKDFVLDTWCGDKEEISRKTIAKKLKLEDKKGTYLNYRELYALDKEVRASFSSPNADIPIMAEEGDYLFFVKGNSACGFRLLNVILEAFFLSQTDRYTITHSPVPNDIYPCQKTEQISDDFLGHDKEVDETISMLDQFPK